MLVGNRAAAAWTPPQISRIFTRCKCCLYDKIVSISKSWKLLSLLSSINFYILDLEIPNVQRLSAVSLEGFKVPGGEGVQSRQLENVGKESL